MSVCILTLWWHTNSMDTCYMLMEHRYRQITVIYKGTWPLQDRLILWCNGQEGQPRYHKSLPSVLIVIWQQDTKEARGPSPDQQSITASVARHSTVKNGQNAQQINPWVQSWLKVCWAQMTSLLISHNVRGCMYLCKYWGRSPSMTAERYSAAYLQHQGLNRLKFRP